MSQLAPNQDVIYDDVRIVITQCTSPAPQCWYRDCIGQTFEATKKRWYEDGQLTNVTYEVPHTPGGGFNGHVMNSDLKEIRRQNIRRDDPSKPGYPSTVQRKRTKRNGRRR